MNVESVNQPSTASSTRRARATSGPLHLLAERPPAAAQSLAIAGRLTPVALGCILLVALAVRFVGTIYDYPFLLQVDETVVIQKTLTMMAAHSLDPQFYYYGPLLMYLEALWLLPYIAVRALLGHAATPYVTYYVFGVATTDDPWIHVYGRLLFVLCGVGAVWLAFLLGRRLAGSWAGLLAAALLALSPLHAAQSALVQPNAPTSFFALLTAFYAVRYLQDGQARTGWRDVILATIAASLGASIKYNAVVLLLVPVLAVFLTHRSAGLAAWIRPCVLLCLLSAAVFLLVSPPAIFNTVAFAHGAAYQVKHYAVLGSGDRTPSILWYGRYLIAQEGLLVFPVAVVGLAVLTWRERRRFDLLLLLTIGCYYLLIGVQKAHYDRNLLVILPLLSVASAYALVRLSRLRFPAGAIFAVIMAGVMLVSLGQGTLDQARLFLMPPPQLVVRSWLQANLPRDTLLLADGYTVPPLDRRDVAMLYMNDIELTPNQIWQRGIRFVVLSRSLWYYERPGGSAAPAAHMIPLYADGGIVVYQLVRSAAERPARPAAGQVGPPSVGRGA
jgi:4-amino-4-deoxy-L-arabinose transferase-like glycosyltransferase